MRWMTLMEEHDFLRRSSWPRGQYLRWVDEAWFMCSYSYQSPTEFDFLRADWLTNDWEPYADGN